MTIAQALKLATFKLSSQGIDNPHLEAEILLSSIIKKPREYLLAHGEKKLTKNQITNYLATPDLAKPDKSLISRRLKGQPIAYLTGHKEFYGLDFKINKNVLIPRPETELIVEETLKLISLKEAKLIIDVGTGSGCIIISLLKRLQNSKLRISPKLHSGQANCEFLATDISAKALAIAKQNAKHHGVAKKIKFIKGNLLEPIINNPKYKIHNTKYIILANLPYGWQAWKNNCSMDTIGLKFEPAIALFTGKNGLQLYKNLLKQIDYLITNYKLQITCLCEFDPRQTAKIKQLIKRELPEAKFQIKKDLSGLNRLVIIQIPSPD